jgi:hypothetical protein
MALIKSCWTVPLSSLNAAQAKKIPAVSLVGVTANLNAKFLQGFESKYSWKNLTQYDCLLS